MLTALVYRASRRFTLLKPHISAAPLAFDERARHYFEYERKKSARFDAIFGLSVKGKTVLEIGSGFGGYMQHALDEGASFIHGIESDEARATASRTLIQGGAYDVITGDARDMNTVPDASIDVVVSDAVLEHIQDIDRLFSEIRRVLRPGGQAHLATSPIWYTWNGGHIARYIPIPWAHLLLPDRVIYAVLDRQRANGDFRADAIENIRQTYATMGKLSLRRLKRGVAASGLRLVRLQNISRSRLKRALMKLPFGEELFAGNICVSLVRD